MRVALLLAFGVFAAGCELAMGGRVGPPPEAVPPAMSSDPATPAQPAAPADDAGIAPSPGDVAI
jgi:hypothetical protein